MVRGLDIVASSLYYWHEVYNLTKTFNDTIDTNHIYRCKSPNIDPKLSNKDRRQWRKVVNLYQSNRNICDRLVGCSNNHLVRVGFVNWFILGADSNYIFPLEKMELGLNKLNIILLSDNNFLDSILSSMLEEYNRSDHYTDYFDWLFDEVSKHDLNGIWSLHLYISFKHIFYKILGRDLIVTVVNQKDRSKTIKRGKIMYDMLQLPITSQLLDTNIWLQKSLEEEWYS